MDTSKLSTGRKCQKGGNQKYDPVVQRKIVREYLAGDLSLNQLGQKYGVDGKRIHEWKKRFNDELAGEIILSPMTEQEQKNLEALQKQVEELKRKLEYEQMKNFAWETMADLASTELGIDLRKNYGAKQPKE
ncbi:MAG: transposase [Bacteroidetes bacterium]|nr:transposase [Bacteroidota bacterium]